MLHSIPLRFSTIILAVIVSVSPWNTGESYAQEEDLTVIKDWIGFSDAENSLYHFLLNQAVDLLGRRREQIQALQTRQDWQDHQQEVKRKLASVVGSFPERTPLNARITGVVIKEGYRVEKIIYESQPGFYVTAALFLPDRLSGPAPAILFCSGHTDSGFRSDAYQTMMLNLVQKGFIVFAFDPVGQGERLQYYDPQANASRIGGPTAEHSYAGAQLFISGSTLARNMIWDGIRAVDYLLTRNEVDPQRLGITGRSGGGTQSSYIAAFDDRILAAAPEAYITSLEWLFRSRGPQDAEQNFFHGIAYGIDHADLLEVRAPKPALMITTTRDIFSIQGARETFAEVKDAYQALGQPEMIRMVEDDAGHASTEKNREAMYAFFQEVLSLPGDPDDQPVELLTEEELRVTSTGQVSTSLDGKTLFSLNLQETQERLQQLDHLRQTVSFFDRLPETVRRLSGFLDSADPVEAVFIGRYPRDGYAVEKYFIQGEGDYVVPFLLFNPEEAAPKQSILYLHPEGKGVEAGRGGDIERLARQGFLVLAPDLPGFGELGPGTLQGDSRLDGVNYNIWFASIQTGRSIVGLHAGDITRLATYLRDRSDTRGDPVSAIARGTLGPALLHAAALTDEIGDVVLLDAPLSYRMLVTHEHYAPEFIPSSVAGALTQYDLPDLAAAHAPGKLLIVNPVDHKGLPADTEVIEQEYSALRMVYQARGAADALRILRATSEEEIQRAIESWLGLINE